MAQLQLPTTGASREASLRINVADRLREIAARMPNSVAVVCPRRWSRSYPVHKCGESGANYATTTFAALDADATRLAQGLLAWGVPPGTRLALLVPPGIEFVTLVFALLRAGVVIVLIDPGMGRRNLIRCLAEAKPEGFVAIPAAHAVRVCLQRAFPSAQWNVTVGRRWFWGGLTLKQLRNRSASLLERAGNRLPAACRVPSGWLPTTYADDPAAIIFTSGSTGPPKGVLYTHRMFDTQAAEIRSMYDIEPGGVDLACFPLFALFNSAMGVTTVLPEMDFSRPASAHPREILAAANDWRVTQAFASPAVWRRLSNYCAKTGERIASLRHVFSCGAPVAADVLRGTLACIAEGARMHTPYGATECLPVSTIEAAEVLNETAAQTATGAGVCVGRPFSTIEWRVIRITDEPISTIEDTKELPVGEIGELIVRGPQASPRYVTPTEANATSKIPDQSAIRNPQSEIHFWHRMGDVGYLDAQGRFWYCGRKSHRVETANGTLYTECIEAVFNTHPAVRRSALVGVGPPGRQTPVIIVECEPGGRTENVERALLQLAQANSHTSMIRNVLFHPKLPVDVRHNAKINREMLAAWAEKLKDDRWSNHAVQRS